MQVKKLFTIIIILSCIKISLHPSIPLKGLTGNGKAVGIPFFSIIEAKKAQIKELEESLEEFKKRSDTNNQTISHNITQVNSNIAEEKGNLKQASDPEETEHLNKKITVLNDRKQNLLNLQELWKITEDTIKKEIKLINDIITFQEKKALKPEIKFMYTWKEFQQTQSEIYSLISKIDSEKTEQDNIRKQKISERETLHSLQNQQNTKKKDHEETLNKINTYTEETGTKPLKILRLEASIIEQEFKMLSEKIEYSKLAIEKLEYAIQLKENEIEYQQYKLTELKNLLEQIKERLVLDIDDIESAKAEWQNEIQKTLQIKEKLNKEREDKKREKNKTTIQLESLKEELKELKEIIVEKKDDAKSYNLEIRIQKLKTSIENLDSELHLIDIKRDHAEVLENLKKIQYEIMDVRHKLNQKEIDLDVWIQYFKNQKEIARSLKKNLLDKQKATPTSLLETSRKIETIRTKEDDLKSKKETIFKAENKLYQETLIALSQTNLLLNKQFQTKQEYLTTNLELTQKLQDDVLNQYEFIIKDLEHKKITLDIWGRSLKAISLEELQKAILDAEAFFRSLFWDTSKYLGPTILIANVKQLKFYDYLWLLLFMLLFLITFVAIRKILEIIYDKTKKLISTYQNSTSYLYLNLIKAIIEFALEHLKLLWGYLFIASHIAFDFKYIFSTITHIVNPYMISMFHIISIPILVYLSKKLLLKIKILNEKLSYLFFAENFQDKFIFLLNAFFYSSAILLPLRLAFISYAGGATEFPDVLLAAYSLILVIVLLLFFSKEDVLKLIPSTNKFFIWIKKKIEKHYYPVFIFLMGFLILSNPYIGYSNLAWYLAFVVPLSLVLIYGLFFVHGYIRKYSLFLFLREEDEELIDKFEYAKTYYGFSIIFTFLALLFVTFLLLARIWNLNYTAAYVWQLLSEEWVIPIGAGYKLGIVQFIIVVTFIIFGFLTSSLLSKFILNKLFDVFRTEPGTQNTISRITHYFTIIIFTTLGFTTIHLEWIVLSIGGLLVLGAGFGLKDLLADFIAGFFLLIERPIEIGHYIQTDDTRGTVHRISPRSTTIRTARNFAIIIPNKDLINKPIINWGQGRFAVGFEMTLLVSYNSDPTKVKDVLLEVIQNNPMILRVPAISIRFEDFATNGIQFFTRAFISVRKVRDQWDIASNLRFEIIKVFRENNIIIPFPQTVVHFAKSNEKMAKVIDIKFDDDIKPNDIKKAE